MRAKAPPSSTRRPSLAARFIRDRRAVTAVEFALVAPIGLVLLFGEYTLCDATSTKRKLTITSHTIVDLVARLPSVSASNMSAILNASGQIVSPYNMSNTSIIVAELTTDASGKTTVTWSQALNTTPLQAGLTMVLPSGMATPNTSLIYSLATYKYTPLLGTSFFGNMVFSSAFYENPRVSATVPFTN